MGGFLPPRIGPHRMLDEFPLSDIATAVERSSLHCGLCQRVAYDLTKESHHEQER